MFEFARKMLLARLIELKEGQVLMMGAPMLITPNSIMEDLQKFIINESGYEKAYDGIYKGSKEGSAEYNKAFFKKYGFKNIERIKDWQCKIVTSAGWGKVSFTKFDLESKRATMKIENSPFPKNYGISKYPVCIVQAGFIAGGLSETFQTDIDGIELTCMSQGNQYCKFHFGPSDVIRKEKQELWKQLGIIKK